MAVRGFILNFAANFGKRNTQFTILTMRPTIIYHLFIIILLATFTTNGAVAQQATDINKPTRTRVKEKDKKNDDKKKSETKDNKNNKDNKKDAKNSNKKEEKPAAQQPQAKPATQQQSGKPAAQQQFTKPAAQQQPAKPAAQQQAAAKPADNKPANKPVSKADSDSAAKAAPVKPPKQTLNPEKVQFDGIDVSKHQGTIDWAQLKNYSKIKFVYIKATEGSDYVDPRYKENIRNARKQGFKVGSYHFLSTKSSATTQFQNFIRTANREEQDLLPVIDIEVTGRWSSQQLRDSLKVFADLVEDYYGCKPLIYTSEKFFTKHLGRAFADYPLFIAKYSNIQPNIGYRWIMWQFSDCGVFKPAVKGNAGEVDLSRFNKGCSINDILYHPSKHKPKSSVHDAVDRKEKPTSVNLTEQKAKEAPKPSKRQQEEAQRQADKEKKAKERSKKLAEEEAKKKAEEAKKAQEKAERLKKEKARQQAHEAALKKEAEEKAKRKAAAKKAREEKTREEKAKKSSTGKSNKSTSLLQTSSSKLSQSQRNDSIRASKNKGRKTNKSSADND